LFVKAGDIRFPAHIRQAAEKLRPRRQGPIEHGRGKCDADHIAETAGGGKLPSQL